MSQKIPPEIRKDVRRAKRAGLSAGAVFVQLRRNAQQWAVLLRWKPHELSARVELARAAVLDVYGARAKVELDQLDLLPPDAGKVEP